MDSVNKLKIIIAGGRDFDQYNYLDDVCSSFIRLAYWLNTIHHPNNIEIVSGTARGADKLGEQYALNNKIPIIRFPADWNTYGKRAGYLRNQEMAKYADVLIAFWDGKSKGTKHMIDLALKHGLEVLVKRY